MAKQRERSELKEAGDFDPLEECHRRLFIGVWPRWRPEVCRPICLFYEGINQPHLSMRQTSGDYMKLYEAIYRL